MRDELVQRLTEYQRENKIQSKGQLAVIIHLCRVAKEQGLPLDSAALVTEAGGQVRGLGKAAVQKVLKDYGIVRVLAEESGRTSRGSLGLMNAFVEFLNGLHTANLADTELIEAWWIDRIRDYFNSRPFTLRYDTSKSLRSVVRDLLSQAEARQKENPGTTYMGTVLQHLVGAKLSVVLPQGSLTFHGASVADSPTARSGDFLLDDVVIHCTTAPSEALMQKCKRNLEAGLRPIIITIYQRLLSSEALAADNGLDGRIDIWDFEQFISTNVYELSHFKAAERRVTVEKLIEAYNAIIDSCETDPSLKVQMG